MSFFHDERIALVGNATAERMNIFTLLDDPLLAFGADTYFCFYGFNESFLNEPTKDGFVTDYLRFLADTAAQYPRDDSGSAPRFVLVSLIAAEDSGDPLRPSADDCNVLLKS